MDLFSVTVRVAAGLLGVLALLCCGCNQSDFSAGTAQALIAQRPIHIDAEQVMLTPGQVDCGKENELWEAPAGFAGSGNSSGTSNLSVAHLTAKARELQFDDDVVLSEPGYSRPYVQIRGDFTVALTDANIHDDGDNGRRVEGKVLVMINHPCFADPLPLMGVKKGKFNEDVLPLMHYTQEADGWHFDKLIH
jgi:hypothetical protein